MGLLALQHRGQESAGMAFYRGGDIECIKKMGMVDHVFSRETVAEIPANTILGHVRYSTTGSSLVANAQPLVARSVDGAAVAIAHNGNLTNTQQLRRELLDEGHIFHTTSDTEIILSYLFRFRRQGLVEAVRKTMGMVEGAYSVVVMDETCLVAFRDPNGFRPLVLGSLGEGFVFASETSALEMVGSTFIREVEPGEIVVAAPGGLQSYNSGCTVNHSLCIFEYVYFARPDSVLQGKSVYDVRKKVGARLAGKTNLDLDMVVPSPDSGVTAAIGLAEELQVPLEWAVYRNPYLGRTFIEPTRDEREMAVRLKFNPVTSLVRGKKVAVVDDSLVRGTTARVLVRLLRAAGALEVHLCIASPPYRFPCYYGIDIPAATNLVASDSDLDLLAGAIGANSVVFNSLEDLVGAVGIEENMLCSACFSGNYPQLGTNREKVN